MAVNEQTRLKLADDVTYQSLGENQDTVVLSLSSGYLYTCNETARALLAQTQQGKTLGAAVDAMVEQFDASREQILADMIALAEHLLEEKLIVVAE